MDKIRFILGGIEHQDTDVIVNPTNSEMVWEETTANGDIHNEAGRAFTIDCKLYIKEHGELKQNDIVMMGGYGLRAKNVLNVYPPFYELAKTQEQNYNELLECYKLCFEELKKLKISSVSFPLISSGAFMYPYRFSFGAFMENVLVYEKDFDEIQMVFVDKYKLSDCERIWKNADYVNEKSSN